MCYYTKIFNCYTCFQVQALELEQGFVNLGCMTKLSNYCNPDGWEGVFYMQIVYRKGNGILYGKEMAVDPERKWSKI